MAGRDSKLFLGLRGVFTSTNFAHDCLFYPPRPKNKWLGLGLGGRGLISLSRLDPFSGFLPRFSQNDGPNNEHQNDSFGGIRFVYRLRPRSNAMPPTAARRNEAPVSMRATSRAMSMLGSFRISPTCCYRLKGNGQNIPLRAPISSHLRHTVSIQCFQSPKRAM